MSKIEQIIEEMQNYLGECKSPTFSGGGKIICEKNIIQEFIEDLKLSTPEEIKKYQKIISQKDMILADAKNRSAAMISDAEAQTQKMVDEHEISRRADEKAKEIIAIAQEDAKKILNDATQEGNNIRMGAMKYTDDILSNLQTTIENAVIEQEDRNASLIDNLKSVCNTVIKNRGELTVQRDEPIHSSVLSDAAVDISEDEDGEIFLRDSFDSEE